jgi:hypothetical protein
MTFCGGLGERLRNKSASRPLASPGPHDAAYFGKNSVVFGDLGACMAIVMNGCTYDRNGGLIVYLIDTETGLPPVLPTPSPSPDPNLPAGEED